MFSADVPLERLREQVAIDEQRVALYQKAPAWQIRTRISFQRLHWQVAAPGIHGFLDLERLQPGHGQCNGEGMWLATTRGDVVKADSMWMCGFYLLD